MSCLAASLHCLLEKRRFRSRHELVLSVPEIEALTLCSLLECPFNILIHKEHMLGLSNHW